MHTDKEILRELGNRLAEIAVLPIQNEKKRLWRDKNGLRNCRPLVCIDQLPWHELDIDDELTLKCEDDFLRDIEQDIRRKIFKWRHFPADMVVENRVDIPKSIDGLRYGYDIIEETRHIDSKNDVISHKYSDQCDSLEALDDLKPDIIKVNNELDIQRLEMCREIFEGVIPVRLSGINIHGGVWDRIVQARSVTAVMFDIIDRPELILKTAEKFRDLTISTLEQCEALDLLDAEEQLIHCTGSYCDELPAPGYDPKHTRAVDCWIFGMAQAFSMVSRDMHEEFEIDIMKPLYEKFGLLYYGCCEPLDNKIDIIRKIRNARKISVSPWADIDVSAEQMGCDFVFSGKPHPGYIAEGVFEEEVIVKQIKHMIQACKHNSTPCELVLKDISTVAYNPEVLTQWENRIMRLVEDC